MAKGLGHRLVVGRRVVAGEVVLQLALDVGQQAAGAEAEEVGAAARRSPSSSFIRISQSSACLAVRMPPAGLKPTR